MLAALPILLATLAAVTPPESPPATSAPTPAASAPASAAADDCPSAAQLADTLNARVPGLVPEAATAPLALASGMRLVVTTSPEGDVRADLVDAKDEVVLHRLLPAPPRGRAPDCSALAETIAIIVERYLHDVGYEAPPLPLPEPKPAPPPPATTTPTTVVAAPSMPPTRPIAHAVRWRVGVLANGRRGDAGGFDGDADLGIGIEGTGDGPHFGARLSSGLAPRAAATWGTTDQATLERIPFRLGLYVGVPLGPGQLEPGVGAGADLLRVSVSGQGKGSGSYLAPSGDLALGYAIPLIGALYGRVLSRVALAEPYTFKALMVPQVWGTPRVFGELGVELGVSFP